MKFIATVFLIFTFGLLQAQTENNIDNQSLLWTRYYNLLTINDKWSVHSEFDNRIFINPTEHNTFVFRVQGRYKISDNIEVGAGYAQFSTSTQNPYLTRNFNEPEYRGQQDISWKQVHGNFTLNQRFQVEERFVHNVNKEGLLPGTTFFWRFRYRFQGEYNFWKKKDQFLKAIAYDEIMINTGEKIVKNTFDQNRMSAAVHFGMNKNIALELGYIYSFQQRTSGVDYFDRDIIRFTFFHKINIQKKK